MTNEFVPPRLETLLALPRANLCPGDPASSLQPTSRGDPPSCLWCSLVRPTNPAWGCDPVFGTVTVLGFQHKADLP